MSKEIKGLVKAIESQGGEVRDSRRNSHLKVYRDGKMVCVLPSTPSDPRAMKNARAQLRRVGFDV